MMLVAKIKIMLTSIFVQLLIVLSGCVLRWGKSIEILVFTSILEYHDLYGEKHQCWMPNEVLSQQGEHSKWQKLYACFPIFCSPANSRSTGKHFWNPTLELQEAEAQFPV